MSDRRAELLELASRLACSSEVARLTPRPHTGTVKVRTKEECDRDAQTAREYHAADTVKQAAAIIAEVDRVSGEVPHA